MLLSSLATFEASAAIEVFLGYVALVAALRALRRAYIRKLASRPDVDPHQVAWMLAFVEFPFMFETGISLGFFSTFAIPSIAATLRATRAFECACQMRFDDTNILMHEVGEFGCQSARGMAALKRINEIHGRHRSIKRDDMLYTLWVFCFEPVYWVNAYDWRTIDTFEKRMLFQYWRQVGEGLHIADIPRTLEEFEGWGERYERLQCRSIASRASRENTMHVIEVRAPTARP